MLFGVRVPHSTAQGHWDFSTLALYSELKKRVVPGQRLLELGTGEAGILSIAMARRVRAGYLAVDLAEEAVSSARRVAAANDANVEFVRSDLLSEVPRERSFDLTFFNPPYVPRAHSVLWKALGEPARVFDGGEDGLEVIRRFFDSARERGAGLGTVLLGFNRRLVSGARVREVAESRGFSFKHAARALHPGTVFSFEASASADDTDSAS
jgi:methylase of polypeptide subunit release factors